MTFNYEYSNKNSNLLYPGKYIQPILSHNLDGDNHNEGNKINEDSIDNLSNSPLLDNYNKNYDDSLISKDSFSSYSQTNEISGNNYTLPSFDNYIKNYDDNNLISKDIFSFYNKANEISENNYILPSFDNSIKNYDDNGLISKDRSFPPYPDSEEPKNKLINSFKNISDINSKNKELSERPSSNKANNDGLKFSIFLKKKRGRKTEKPNEKFHDCSADDNCLRKIQNHFFKFIIDLTNEVLKKINIEEDFKPIDYKIKSNVNHNFFCELKKKSIKNILEMKISPKYKSKSKDINREVINKIYKIYNNSIWEKDLIWLKEFFNINYLDLFSEYYYNNEKSLLKFVFKEKEIELSKTKSFYYLLDNKNNKDKKISKDLSDIAKRFFIASNSGYNKTLFQTEEIIDLKK